MISVCIATYNGEEYVKDQIESILAQLSPDDEIIISDDGSTDHTLSIIQDINALNIKVLPPRMHNSQRDWKLTKYEEFGTIYKVAMNFVNAIMEAKGDTIYLSDQDDVWLPDKISVCERILKEYDVVVHRRTDVDRQLNPLSSDKVARVDKRKATFIQSLKQSHFQGACMGFTKRIKSNIIMNLDLFKNIPLSHDHAIGYIALSAVGEKGICFEPKSLMLYRRHGNNVSPTGEKSRHSLQFKILYRWNDLRFYAAAISRNCPRKHTLLSLFAFLFSKPNHKIINEKEPAIH